MKTSFGKWAVMAVCVVSPAVHAEVLTFPVGAHMAHDGWSMVVPEGRATLQLSSQMSDFLRLSQAVPAAVDPASLQVSAASFSMTAPATSLTGDWSDHSITVQALQTAGGFTLSTDASVAAHGAGFLSISNIWFDLLNREIRADIEGGHGVGVILGHRLWSFATQSEPLVMTLEGHLTPGHVVLSSEISVSGVYLTTDALDMMQKALNLNDIGRALLDGSNHEAGFGTFVLAAVPEPSGTALVVAGMLGLGLMARRHHSSMNRSGS
jgi:hypothetical protein